MQVNATGVMPVIFSTTLLSLPTGLAKYAAWLEPVAVALGPAGLLYIPVGHHSRGTSCDAALLHAAWGGSTSFRQCSPV